MKNVTITMEDEVAHWARVKAAEADTSVSRFLGEMARKQMNADRAYEEAMRSFFSRGPKLLSQPGQPYPTREELHDRAGLR